MEHCWGKVLIYINKAKISESEIVYYKVHVNWRITHLHSNGKLNITLHYSVTEKTPILYLGGNGFNSKHTVRFEWGFCGFPQSLQETTSFHSLSNLIFSFILPRINQLKSEEQTKHKEFYTCDISICFILT